MSSQLMPEMFDIIWHVGVGSILYRVLERCRMPIHFGLNDARSRTFVSANEIALHF
jgi:hypothetical protein